MLSGRITLVRQTGPPGPGHSYRVVIGCGNHVICLPTLRSGESAPFSVHVDPETCGDKLSVIAYERDDGHPLVGVAGYAFFTLAGNLAHVPVVSALPRKDQTLIGGTSVPVITTADERDVVTANAQISDIRWTDRMGGPSTHPDMSAIYRKLDASVEPLSHFMADFDPYENIGRFPPLDHYNGKPIFRPGLIKDGRIPVFEVPGAQVDGKRANFPIAFYFEPMQDGTTSDAYLRHLLVLSSARYACEAASVTRKTYGTFLTPEEMLDLGTTPRGAQILARIYGMAAALPSCSRQYNSDHILTTRTETEIENFGSPVNSGTDDCDGFAWLSAWTHREMLLRGNSECRLLAHVATHIANYYHEIPILTTSTSASSTHHVSRESEHSAIHLVLALVRKDIVASWTGGKRVRDSVLPGVMFCEGTANNEPWWRMAKDIPAGDYELARREKCENLYRMADESGISGYRRYTEARVVAPGPYQYEHPFYRVGILALIPTPGGPTHYTEFAFLTEAHTTDVFDLLDDRDERQHGAVLESLETGTGISVVPTKSPGPEIMSLAKDASCLIPRSLVPQVGSLEMKTSPFSVAPGHVCVPFIFTRGCPDPSRFHQFGHPFVHYTECVDSETRQDVVLVYPSL